MEGLLVPILIGAVPIVCALVAVVLNYLTRDRVAQLNAEVTRLGDRLDRVESDLDEERSWTRKLEDYAHRLRRLLESLGADIPEWPQREGI